MKKILSHLVYSTMILAVVACSKTEHHDDEGEMVEWKEMDDFHTVMADVFHPLKDSGNLEPIKLRAEELAASASAWADATLPEKVDNDEMKGMLMKLKDGTRSLADQIKAGAADDVIQSQLTALHDQFHSVQEKWYGGGETHHQH